MKPLNLKDIAIIDAFPVYDMKDRPVLNVGCGDGRIDFHLAEMGYTVYATDIANHSTWEDSKNLTFHKSDIFDLSSFPVPQTTVSFHKSFNSPDHLHHWAVVICSQVLEHLKGYRTALINLVALASERLIITVPFHKSFNSPDHLHHWNDEGTGGYRNINEFKFFLSHYSVSISKIRTKPADIKANKSDYLIVIDKRQVMS